ncbi:helix-turn-helix domain-containing protein [Hymenobacter profundi]|uniref:Helix-turn-helix domain-containing protein n=1 Tax=Hymenobacter profundi TaxID=1982110 RepID=A0ABS6WZ40_9BACT|nr:helix-turn-helix transcriptional regulator [Hymenobacter profundi]MBW3128870.1 helix-turn-helix domain-containing protein [Hymenobacter profundi]
MFSRREILSHPSYWLTEMRTTVFEAVSAFMTKRNMTRRQLAEHLDCSPGYVSQMLNGDTNASLEKLSEVCLAIGVVPRLRLEDLDDVLKRDEILGFTLSSQAQGVLSMPSSTKAVTEKPAAFI